MRLAFYIVKDGGSRSSKARHGFEESVSKTRDVSAQPIGKASEEGESYPASRNSDIAVAP